MKSSRITAPPRLLAVVTASLLWLWWTPVRAGPPFVTDDPEPVEYRHWEFYLSSVFSHAPEGDAGAIPLVEVNYGLVPDVQIHLVAPLAYARERGGRPRCGYGDTELGAKYRFLHETSWRPQVGIFPLIEVPTGNERSGLGNGTAQVFLPVWVQKTLGPWTTYGGAGYSYDLGAGHSHFWRFGWLLQRDLNEHITIGAEVYHETPAVVGADGHTAFNLGGYLNFDPHKHLLFSAGRDAVGPNRLSCYLGLQFTT